MEETLAGSKQRWGGAYRKASVEVRLLYATCWCFIIAQYVVNDHPWNSGFRIAGLLALIAAIWIGARERNK